MYLEIIASVAHALGPQKEASYFVTDFLENPLCSCEKEVITFVSCIYTTLYTLFYLFGSSLAIDKL